MLQKKLWDGEMFFEIEKPSLLYSKQHFDNEEVILQQLREQVLYFYIPVVKNIAAKLCFKMILTRLFKI